MKFIASLLLSATMTTPLFADCTRLVSVQNFDGNTEAMAATLSADRCSRALATGGQQMVVCQWGFDFRAEAASAFYDSLRAEAETCLTAAPPTADQPVNHPDSFFLAEFVTEQSRLSVSLKDKGALQQSFVFLSYSPK